MRKSLVAAVAGAVMTVGLSVMLPATGASAAVTPAVDCTQNPSGGAREPNHFIGNGVNIRTGPSTSCTIVGEGFKNQSVTVHCYRGNWDYLKDNATGKLGWVVAQLIDVTPNLPAC